MVTVYTEKTTMDDIVRKQYDEQYCMQAITLYNRTNGTLSNSSIMGQPLRADESVAGAFMFCLAAGIAYCTGILIEVKSLAVQTMADNATMKTKALVRGPAIIDKNALPAADVAGTSITLADWVTAIEAFDPPVLCNAELSPTVTQTT